MRVRAPRVWTAFIIAIVAVFIILETAALVDPRGLSLSQWYVDLAEMFPPIKTLVGIVIGMLITHFGWHWVPKQNREVCMLCGDEKLIKRHGG